MSSRGSSKFISGIIWNSFQVFGNQLFGLLVKIVLARLLLPEEFGLLSMALVFTGLVGTINEMGMSAALVQRKEESITEAHYASVFYLSLATSVVFFLLGVFIIAPVTAAFYAKPELTNLTRAIMIPLLFNPVGIISRAKLTRNMQFKELSLASIVASVVSGCVAMVLAYIDFGVWALIIQSVLASAIASAITGYNAPWWPKAQASYQAIKDVLGYSLYVLLNSIAVFFTKNTDYLLIGKMLGSQQLGIYTIAFILPDMLRSQVMGILNTVLFPVYSKLQNDKAGILAHYHQVVRYNCLLIFPGLAIMAVFPHELIALIFGPEWAGAEGALRILACSAAVHVSGGASSTVLSAIGKPKLDFQLMLLTTVTVTIPLFYVGIKMAGIEGCAYGALIGKIVSVGIRQQVLLKLIGMTKKSYLTASFYGLRGAAGVAVTGYALQHWAAASHWEMALKLALALSVGYLVNIGEVIGIVMPVLKSRLNKKTVAA